MKVVQTLADLNVIVTDKQQLGRRHVPDLELAELLPPLQTTWQKTRENLTDDGKSVKHWISTGKRTTERRKHK